MTDLKNNRNSIPDWHPPKAIVLVYPFMVTGREHLIPFYKKFLSYVPTEIKIILLVKDTSCEKDIRNYCAENGIQNEVEIIHYPNIFDIWIRDYAPLIIKHEPHHFPVKFKYFPSYVDSKYEKYILDDDQIGEHFGKKLLTTGIDRIGFVWDMGNLTHNGAGTAIISNHFIADNKTRSIENELKPVLNGFCGFSNIIFIPTEPNDATGHVDGMCRFINEKTLVIGAYPAGSANYKFMELLAENLKEEIGKEYKVLRLLNGEPEDCETEGVGSALGNHINFLRLGDKILMPYYEDEISGEAVEMFVGELKRNNLDIEIIPVEMPEIVDLARLGGVLNCVGWQYFKGTITN